MHYTVQGKSKEEIVRSKQALLDCIKKEFAHDNSEIWLIQNTGKMKGVEKFFYKLLGLRTNTKGLSLYILSKTDIAVLVFLDEDDNESVAINDKHNGPDAKKEDFFLNSGEISIHSSDECINKDVAIKAMLYFYEFGKKPNWLKYK